MKKIFLLLIACISCQMIIAQTKVKIKPMAKTMVTKKVVVKNPIAKSTTKKTTATKENFKIPEGAIVLPSGIIYKNIIAGTGTYKPVVDDNILMHIRAYVSDSMLFDSYRLNNDEPVPAKLIQPQFNGDIMAVFPLMVEGDSSVIFVHQDSLYRNGMRPPFAKPGDMVKYQIKMIGVKSKADYDKEQKEAMEKAITADEEKIKAYIEEKKLLNVRKTASGLYYQITKLGTGPNPTKGSQTTMNYTGYLLDGTVFDSNVDPKFSHVEPFKFPLGKGAVIKGWDEGVALLSKGAKAKLLIPSPLAYGPQARPGLPANSVLIFDVELLEFN
jgi:FKBP-type peptidyl-prolyl cis-trans isomerase